MTDLEMMDGHQTLSGRTSDIVQPKIKAFVTSQLNTGHRNIIEYTKLKNSLLLSVQEFLSPPEENIFTPGKRYNCKSTCFRSYFLLILSLGYSQNMSYPRSMSPEILSFTQENFIFRPYWKGRMCVSKMLRISNR